MLKGILYNSVTIYNLVTKIKLGKHYSFRYELCASNIKTDSSILDICPGPGDLKNYLPSSIKYETLEYSKAFISALEKKGVTNHKINLHNFNEAELPNTYDVVVMLISLYPFRNSNLNKIINFMKNKGKKVIIIEEVILENQSKNSSFWKYICQKFGKKFRDYICHTDCSQPADLFSEKEFIDIMNKHNFTIHKHPYGYMLASFEK